MAASRLSGRHKYEQRVAVLSWAAFTTVGAVSAWAYLGITAADSDSLENAAPRPAPTMHQWLEATEPLINDLVGARNEVAAAAAHHDISGTGAACQVATGAVEHLNQQLPSPDPTLNSTLQQVISNYTIGLPYCISATRSGDGNVLHTAATYISQGDGAMQLALDIVDNAPGSQPGTMGVLIA